MRWASLVRSSSGSRIALISRPISASVSSVSAYSRSDSNSLRRGDRLRDVRAELPQDPLVALGERAELVAEQVERADHLALVAQRHRQLRLRARHHREVARILIDVVEQDRPLFGDRGADRALPDLAA